jgi:hypothetical protein
MRIFKILCLLSLTLLSYKYSQAGAFSTTTGKPVIKPQISNGLNLGAWTFTYYTGPNERNASSTSMPICISAKNWSSTATVVSPVVKSPIGTVVAQPFIPASGEWNLDKGTYLFYGTEGEAIQGAAFSAFAQQVNETLLMGHFVNFNISSGNTANAVYGTFKAVYVGTMCLVY